MDQSSAPDDAEQYVLGKRKRAEGTLQENDQEPQGDDASQIMQSVVEPTLEDEQPSDSLAKRSRIHDHDTASPPQASPATMLPLEVLQHIFSFLDPASLGRLLSVSHAINLLLDPLKALPPSSTAGRLRLRPQNDVWATSRRAFSPTTPRPMQDMTELEMWRLIRGPTCQFCGKKPKGKVPVHANSPWHSGPGPEGVRPIWPFRVRSCANCLKSRLVKDSELFLSTSSVLIPGLPFAGFTSSFDYVTSTTLRHNQPPPSISLTKYYFRTQIQALESTIAEVRALGEGALVEWYRGLENSGQSQMADAARFEQWEASVITQVQHDSAASRRIDASESTSSTASPAQSMSSSAVHSAQWSMASPNPFTVSTPQYLGGQPASVFGSSTPSHIPFQSLSMLASQQSPQRKPFPLGSFSPMSVGSQTGTAPPYRRKPEKNFQEIIRLKAERRAEIERRCLDLDPPIRASTLTYMDAFNAAVQIPMPLNDNAWEALKTRLLAQRPAAEQKEAENVMEISSPDASLIIPSKTEHRPVAELDADQLWEEIKKSPRDKIKVYANDYISSIWADGKSITKATTSKFAADVLVHVRRHFYETIMEEDHAMEAKQIVIPPDSLPDDTRKLRLEDMRWIFQEAIRPHTERFGREIFLCSACDTGTKRFSFDAVIQHYAAKHTSTLSHGNAVVHWKAEWPVDPPFHPAPDTVWNREPDYRPTLGSHYASSQYATSPPYFLSSGPSWMSPMYSAPGQPNGLYTMQSDALASIALEIWDATDQIHGLPDSVRLYVIIHQVIIRLSQRFANEAPLSMFADCINHKPALRDIRLLGDLQCKSCLAFGNESGQDSLGQDSPKYIVPELLDHFQKTHLELDARSPPRAFGRPMSMSSMDAPRMDWKFDMIELPHESVIRDLMYAPGMNLQKLQVIASVLPHYFPQPLPPIEPVPFEARGPSRASGPYGHSLQYQEHERRIIHEVPPPHYVSERRHDSQLYRQPHERLGRHPEINVPAYEVNYDAHRHWEVMSPPKIIYVEPPPHVLRETDYVGPGGVPYDARRVYEYNQNEHHPPRGRSELRDSHDAESPRPKRQFSPAVGNNSHRDGRAPLEPPEDIARIEPADSSPTKAQSRPVSPQPAETLNAVENFFKKFDSIGTVYSTGNTPRRSVFDAQSPPIVGSSTRYAERGRRSHMGTPSGIRDVEGSSISHGSGSRRRSPPRNVSGQSHSRTESPVIPFDGPPSPPPRASMLADDKHAARGMDYDRQAPPETSSIYPRHGYETYADSDPPPSQYHGYSRERAPFDRQYRPYEHVPKRYVEILPDGQQRIIEEIPGPFDQVEYIQPPSEDYGGSSSSRGGYYTEMAKPRQRDIRYVSDGPSQGGPLRPSSPRNERHYQRRP